MQVIQGGIPGGPYLQQLYQNAQGQLIMPSNLTLQPAAAGMNTTPIQPNTLNGLNQPLQVRGVSLLSLYLLLTCTQRKQTAVYTHSPTTFLTYRTSVVEDMACQNKPLFQ